MRVRVDIRLKPGVLDPQGQAVRDGLRRLGFDGVGAVRVGKVVELEVGDAGADAGEVRARAAAMCDALLANPVVEDYTITLPAPG